MKLSPFWPLVLLLVSFSSVAAAKPKILFEGYYKVTSGDSHVGYYIQRYELEPKQRQFISTYFLRTNAQGGNISESLKAYATDKLHPIKYQYTSLQGTVAKTIDANVRKDPKKGNVLQVKVTENGKLRVYEQPIKEGVFFSTFLIYLLLQAKDQNGQPKGLATGLKYDFHAVAEEDGQVFPGEVFIDSEVTQMNMNTFKTLYTFKRTQFVNFLNAKGESIISVSPAIGISATLVKSPAEATQGMTFNQKSLELLFGDLPKGEENQVARVASADKGTASLKPEPEKKYPPASQEKEK